MGDSPRRVLFLQGPPTRFWPELADAFEARGHFVSHINLSSGDWLYWRRRGAVNYRGRFSDWRSFLSDFVAREAITDILYYADCLPYHVVAREVAARAGIKAIAVEFGYLRPDWLTLERDGMGVHSHFPDNADQIRQIASGRGDPDLGVHYTHTFSNEAFNEVVYHLTTYFMRPFFPFYRADRYYNPVVEYLSHLPHMAGEKAAARHAEQVTDDCAAGRWPYFLLAHQLQSDYQIRANSPYRHLRDMLDEVFASFARTAPAEARLVVKLHPLDNSLEGWTKFVPEAARRHGLGERVLLIDGGNLDTLLAHAQGCIIVNSTVGLRSIQAACPTKVLGIAVFDMEGLTHQGPLDSFWRNPEPVDRSLARDLVAALAATIQIKGSFYQPDGRKLACAAIVERIAEQSVNEPGAFVDPPPRMARARAMGISV